MPSTGRIRIVGGLFRRTVIPVPDVKGLRPTPDRVRETVFNWLDQQIPGARCLDLFAGSGALGIEAASRGAITVVINDASRVAYSSIKRLADKLAASKDVATAKAASGIDVRSRDAIDLLNTLRAQTCQFDVIFLDPPFQSELARTIEPLIASLLAPNGAIYLEASEPVTEYAGLKTVRSKKAGQVHYHLLNALSDLEPA